MQLSKRMRAAADLVMYEDVLADIGCDHGYLPIALVKEGRIKRAIAMDVKEGPLQKAKEHVALYGLQDFIELRLSDGLEKLKIGEASSISICGMGGHLITRILAAHEDVAVSAKELILGAQSDLDLVRSFLLEHGFYLAEEDFLEEEGKYYTLIRAIRGEKEMLTEAELRYGPRLLQKQNSCLHTYLLGKREHFQKVLLGLEAAKSDHAKERYQELIKELQYTNDAIRYYESTNNH